MTKRAQKDPVRSLSPGPSPACGRGVGERAKQRKPSFACVTRCITCLIALLLTNYVNAAFPDKPFRVVVPAPVGGASDLCLRAVTDVMRVELGQNIVVENISGATGNIGLERVGNATPDGYTLAQPSAGNTSNLAARPKAAFDILSLKPVGKVCQASFTLAVTPTLNVKTVDDLVRYAKANPGKVSFASIGHGSSQHLVGEMFAAATGLDLLHVPFRGESVAVPEMAAGRVQMMFMAGAKPFMDGGLVVGIATTNRDIWPPIPNVPPIGKTSVLPGFSYNGWNGLFAPKGTPDDRIRRISAALQKALADEKVRAVINTLGNQPGAGTPEELAAQVKSDLANFRRIIEQRKLVFPE
jgi:tripartite-type tricarboxylate transporter receptor subunit TctC